jgi:hypothetical protein
MNTKSKSNKTFITMALLMFFATALKAQHNGTNWSEHIAPILYSNCTNCHHDGGIGGFSLINYQDAYPRRYAMKFNVEENKMPPWPPDPKYTHFAGELVLSDIEKELIIDWVDDSAPLGDPLLAPDPPVYDNKPKIVNPDLIVQIPTFSSVAKDEDNYRCFVIPIAQDKDEFISEIEIIPGNNEIVHHVLIFQDTSSIPMDLDAKDSGPGYTYFGSTGSKYSSLIGGWVPGMGATRFPKGMGVRFVKKSNIIIQIHYPKGSDGQVDSTKIRFRYSPTKVNRELLVLPILGHHNIDDGPLAIKANTVDTFHQSYLAPNPGSIISVLPHMHLIGKSYKVWVERLNGDTTWLINIPQWDFHWQMVYNYRYIQAVFTGETVRAEAVYDNTRDNPNNPNDPPEDVGLGDNTTDEMMLIFFYFTNYQDGDENLIVDSTGMLGITKLLRKTVKLYPNPAQSKIVLDLKPLHGNSFDYTIIDIRGKEVGSGTWTDRSPKSLNVESWPSGFYFIRIDGESEYVVERFLKQ